MQQKDMKIGKHYAVGYHHNTRYRGELVEKGIRDSWTGRNSDVRVRKDNGTEIVVASKRIHSTWEDHERAQQALALREQEQEEASARLVASRDRLLRALRRHGLNSEPRGYKWSTAEVALFGEDADALAAFLEKIDPA